eukprot:TRINITY_DN4712_c0_g1_i1.p1 TRINITY_DN4712_c0_g1~~TRINITY_DN4712_c0_g1_i1.p1  ORF type:complete len:852 (-),score=335.25 TRINITY_DN4712_c0_g1_i1:305-2518(-)
MPTLSLTVTKCPEASLALTNKVFLSPQDFRALTSRRPDRPYGLVNGQFVYTLDQHASIEPGKLGLSSLQRGILMLSLHQAATVDSYEVNDAGAEYLATCELAVAFNKKSQAAMEFDVEDIQSVVRNVLDTQILTMDQQFVLDVQGVTLKFKVVRLGCVSLDLLKKGDLSEGMPAALRGMLTTKTSFVVGKAHDSAIRLKGGASGAGGQKSIFRPGWDFEQMGIGGLDEEFSGIFRRAFASRVFPSSVIRELGIHHVRGILLYGPPGTGKTLMARQIGKMLNGKEPKIVAGPEIMNKFVGESENNIRKLFVDAEKEQAQRGDDSDLHIIIFDEIDAICKTRGSTNSGTGVNDSVVNQLLAKIDGVDSLNNVLLIGMTNRKDMIDEALLRPGRLEVHMEISLPDFAGRLQIFRIHTAEMRKSNRMAGDVDLEYLAESTKNYTGAEIEGVVKSASSFALNRNLDTKNLSKAINTDSIIVERNDFEMALEEVKPKFGVTNEEFEGCMPNGIIDFGDEFHRLTEAGSLFLQQIHTSERTRLVSVLLDGEIGSGKTAFAANLALKGGFPFVKLISPDQLVGFSETGKAAKIQRVFEDAYKSPLSVILVDDLERLLDYVPIGPRFSNAVLQTLLVLIKRPPPPGKRLFVIGTTSKKRLLADMGCVEVFSATLTMPNVRPQEAPRVLQKLNLFSEAEMGAVAESILSPIPIKRLLMVAEMAKQGKHGSVAERFQQCITDYMMSGF